MNSRLFGTLSVVVTLTLLSGIFETPIHAQALGTINGTVTDPSGAIVPSATVRVTAPKSI